MKPVGIVALVLLVLLGLLALPVVIYVWTVKGAAARGELPPATTGARSVTFRDPSGGLVAKF